MNYSVSAPRAAFIGCALLVIPLADAAKLTIKPGKWEIATTIVASFFPQPQTKTVTECLKQTEADPLEMFKNEDSCQASNVKQSGNSVSWDMSCKGGKSMPAMDGNAKYASTGETMEGIVKVQGSFQGQQFSMETKSVGSYVGACD